jgi:hypothetical protein
MVQVTAREGEQVNSANGRKLGMHTLAGFRSWLDARMGFLRTKKESGQEAAEGCEFLSYQDVTLECGIKNTQTEEEKKGSKTNCTEEVDK